MESNIEIIKEVIKAQIALRKEQLEPVSKMTVIERIQVAVVTERVEGIIEGLETALDIIKKNCQHSHQRWEGQIPRRMCVDCGVDLTEKTT